MAGLDELDCTGDRLIKIDVVLTKEALCPEPLQTSAMAAPSPRYSQFADGPEIVGESMSLQVLHRFDEISARAGQTDKCARFEDHCRRGWNQGRR